MFVIKLTDPQYSKPAFCIKDCIPAFGKTTVRLSEVATVSFKEY